MGLSNLRRGRGGGRGGSRNKFSRHGRQRRSRRPWRAVVGLALASSLAAAPAEAQRTTRTNSNAWFTVNGDVALDERWGILFDVSVRRSGPVDEWQAFFARAGIAYTVSEHVRVAAGANRSESWPYGELPIAYRYPEWRAWQQVVLSHEVGPLDFGHRYRLEQRWQGRRVEGVEGIDHWMRTSRFRYQVRGTLPLRGESIDPGEAYVTLANELFINFGANIQHNIFDQNRASAAVGWRLSRPLRAEIGFLEQLSLKPNGRDVERNHTLTVALSIARPAPSHPRS